MGARGPGAVAKKPKPAAKETGRPPIRLSSAVYEALREPTLRAVKVLDELLKSDDERTRLLAGKALLEFGTKPQAEPEQAAVAPAQQVVRVVYASDYRASTG